ncbi:MAG: hypothetical protein IT211_11350 [Armatimonadetes bacterium]|nr:hypothetical protein [Armatimonadota bacterium]
MEIANQHIEKVIQQYIRQLVESNKAAQTVHTLLSQVGVGLRPSLDHLSIRTLDVQERALEFEALGFRFDANLGVIERDSWWGKVYRKPGFPPIYIDQAFAGARGEGSPIPGWVKQFTDAGLHHMAVAVEDIEVAAERFASHGISFEDSILGMPGDPFRQLYSIPEMIAGTPHTVIELVERRWGYTGFISPLAGTL